MTTTSKNHSNRIMARVSICVVVISVILIIFLVGRDLLQGTEERTSGTIPDSTISAVTCTATNPEEAFFSTPTSVLGGSHEIKITSTKNSAVDKVFYTYETNYASNEDASKAEAQFRANYNKALTIDNAEKLSPNFSVINNKLQITLFGDVSELTSITAQPFFITADDFKSISNFDVPTLTELYQSKGFTCVSQK